MNIGYLTNYFRALRPKKQIVAGFKFILFVVISAFIFISIRNLSVEAAMLYFSPATGSYNVGQNFSVEVYVSTPDQAMNAVQVTVNFPTENLEIVSISKLGTIANLWVQEPSYSNADGTVSFAGVVTNPGFIGQKGKIFSATFKVKNQGQARIGFTNGSILANDGQGTQILDKISEALLTLTYKVTGPTAQESTTPVEASGVPLAPKISSPTHPDPNSWYSDNSPKFTWPVPAGTVAVKILYNKLPSSQPTILYGSEVSEKQLNDISDGIWYFHVQLKNKSGWGAISNFRFQIDTKSPEPFSIKFAEGKETDNPKPTALFSTTDSLSGVNNYKTKIGEGDFFDLPGTVNQYTLPSQYPGKRNILIQAFDKAGNYSFATEEFTIKPINSPVITDYPPKLESGGTLFVRGETYSDSQVIIYIQREKNEVKNYIINSDVNGKFSFAYDEKPTSGIYELWAETIDSRGARSYPGEKITILVEQPTVFKIGSWAVSFLAIVVPLIALIILLVFIVWYSLHRVRLFKKRIKKEIKEAEATLHKTFNFLRKDIQSQIGIIEKIRTVRQLTKEEEKIVEHLKKDLDIAEQTIKKNIEDIEEANNHKNYA